MSFPTQAAISTVVNGASYQAQVAPNSWAVAFGTSMAQTTAIATLTADGQWPMTLGGITIQVDGKPAELYYVSSNQINFLVPDGTTFGSLEMIIIDVASGASQSATISVQNTAVGLFSSASSGVGPGQILNGVTYAASPFQVETPENGGSDLRTRLAVYCTGIRYAGNPSHDASMTNVAAAVTAQGTDTSGNRYSLTVEYAGVAPGYIGLDQVNIVLPAQLDGAGVVSLTLSAENSTSNGVTFQVNSLPASSIRLVSLTLSANEITGGNNVTGTVALNGLARSSGFPIAVRSSLTTTQQPPIVLVAQGQVSATFTINTPSVSIAQSATIAALAGGSTQTATLAIDPSTQSQLGSFTITPGSVQGGTSLSATVGLTANASPGSVNVLISSDNPAAQPPPSVAVTANTASASFTIPTSSVNTPQTAHLTATLGNKTLNQQVSIVPALQLTLANTTVTAGTAVTGTVTLGKPAPVVGATITLGSSAPNIASLPGTVTVPTGQSTATFTITTLAVTATRSVTITATYAAAQVTQVATLTVNPAAAGQLDGLAVSPTQVSGGAGATGTVTLSGPAQSGGLTVSLRTSNTLVASVPVFVMVPQGQTSANFTIATFKVASSTTVTITATSGTISKTATLTVN